ncbi:translocation protein TolB [Bacillus mesophilum]|uniref:Translocation protein TolB n=1 Tax=Bacillus mesophilum TaxID=1071718 RepID=A0A7V7RKR2_9BACI|nr:translocation protein TolB [Bacillus mesophilum]KAB2331936.1 translocation protein TolB [Bacillus mesophilum]
MKIRVLLFLMIFLCFQVGIASAESPLTAAFIRDHQLWIKQGEKEVQLTKGAYVRSPKWSYDGRFIAYTDGDESGEKSELFIYDIEKKESFQHYPHVNTFSFKWSPVRNQLAYTDGTVLNVTNEKNGRPQGFENVSLGVSSFEWFPNGKEFIVSAEPSISPAGWGPIHLFKVASDANLSQDKIHPFYTIQTNDSDLFAIYANDFKWSYDGKWLSMIAIPTASWSNDSNSLCVIDNQGGQFQKIGNMLGFKDWVKWAPSSNQLAYISGEGRFFVKDKKTAIADMPAIKNEKVYTPEGFVDLDLEWFSQNEVIVARAKENLEWNEGPVPTMYTALYVIDIHSSIQKQISFPKKREIDLAPQVVGNKLTWKRSSAVYSPGDVWVRDGVNGEEYVWLKNIEEAPVFYQKRGN